MSFYPNRLLLFRYRAGLPSCLPHQRPRSGPRYQQRRPLGARYFAENASQPNITVPGDILDDMRISAGSYDVVSEDTTPSVPVTVHGDVTGPSASIHLDDFGKALESALNKKHPRSVPSSGPNRSPRDEAVGLIHYYHHLNNGTRVEKDRYVSRGMLEKEMSIRSRTLLRSSEAVSRWRKAHEEIVRARSLEIDPQEHQVELYLSEDDEALLQKLKADSRDSFREAWEALSKSEKGVHWERLSLWLLYHLPRLVPDFLRITCQSPEKPVFIMVASCILYLTRFFPQLADQSLIMTCLHPDTWPVLILPQKGVRLYLRAADRNGVYYAWNLARKNRMHMIPQTFLCFMMRFTEFGDVNSALQALLSAQYLGDPDFSLKSKAVMHHCCKLLMLDSVVEVGKKRNFRILPKLLALGVRPDRDMMNIVLSNAFKTTDPLLAQNILEYMSEQKMEPDSYTYLTLFKNAVATGDKGRVGSLLQDIQSDEELRKNPWISSKILHSHFVFTVRKINQHDDPNAVFYSMLDMYNELHDITPLKELSIVPLHYTPPSGSGNSPPSAVALYIMIATYLRCLKNISSTQRVYNRFLSLVSEGHEAIAPLSATDHIYNEFLVAFRRDVRGLQPSIRLVEHMLRCSFGDGLGIKSGGRQFEHAAPSVRTWTILMSVFVYNKQNRAADKVRAMMDRYGVEYNQHTWKMIINNHAGAQDISALAKTIREMESEGITLDSHMSKHLRYLRDPERLWVAIEELDRASDQHVAATLSTPDVTDQEEGRDTGSPFDRSL